MPRSPARLGVTDRHLRRIFQAAHGVAPIDYLTTQRLLLAKQLLTDTTLPVTQVALASGFASLRRFNAAFVERYRLNPSALRRNGAEPVPARARGAATAPGLPPAVRDAALLRLLRAARACAGIEPVEGERCAARCALRASRPAVWPAGSASSFVAERHETAWSHAAPTLAPVARRVLQRAAHRRSTSTPTRR